MSVRKRVSKTDPSKFSWVVDYKDGQGTRRLKTFAKKKDADAFAATAHVEVREGVHVADGASCSVREAGKLWIAARERAGRERTTIAQYQNHLDLHIYPHLGSEKLTSLSVPRVRTFEEWMLDNGRSPAMVRKVLVSLGSLLADAQERGLVARNVIRDLRGGRGASDHRAQKRAKGRLKIGADIPTPAEIRSLIAVLTGKWRPVILTAIFTGMRASELRGLSWDAVDFEKKIIRVYQRADSYREIGRPKSESGEREIPMTPMVANTLKEWRLQCPKGKLNLVFPNTKGGVEGHSYLAHAGIEAAWKRAGIVRDTGQIDEKGPPVIAPKYTGMHCLRHFYASWCINRRSDGGLELPPKVVQERLGHSSITMTVDVYGHLFPRGDDAAELAAAEASLFA
ncbi:tyrosine-type recombinase/integrase [Devosia naphthalenivorans]|uniref:tyrosine-type recombinase/integrase n=1 Tax=Devosia naphthalenivorans TaxID=2082392 RepID=UPI000D3D0CE5|nr:site-specific integrase [Devosia naphthalenivorans]